MKYKSYRIRLKRHILQGQPVPGVWPCSILLHSRGEVWNEAARASQEPLPSFPAAQHTGHPSWIPLPHWDSVRWGWAQELGVGVPGQKHSRTMALALLKWGSLIEKPRALQLSSNSKEIQCRMDCPNICFPVCTQQLQGLWDIRREMSWRGMSREFGCCVCEIQLICAAQSPGCQALVWIKNTMYAFCFSSVT